MSRSGERPVLLLLLPAAALVLTGCVSTPESLTPSGATPLRSPVSVAPPSPLPSPSTGAEVAERFHAAVAAGSRTEAAKYADPASAAIFEPYRPMFNLVLSAPVGDAFSMRSDSRSFRCTLVDLTVTGCMVEVGAEDPLDRGRYARYETLTPDPGGVALTVTGPTGAGPEAFAVEALGGGGEMLDVVLTPAGGGTVAIYDPTGTAVAGDVAEAHVELTTTGTYLVVVTPAGAGYTLDVGVSVPAG